MKQEQKEKDTQANSTPLTSNYYLISNILAWESQMSYHPPSRQGTTRAINKNGKEWNALLEYLKSLFASHHSCYLFQPDSLLTA